jgi:hypothetical protein
MLRSKRKFAQGDVFLVEQRDEVCSVGQVLEAVMANAVSCAFYDLRVPRHYADAIAGLSDDRLISALTVTSGRLTSGAWRIVDRQAILLDRRAWPNASCREQNWIGAVIFDAEVAEDLLNAYNGLAPWDDWHDPAFLDQLLAHPGRRPPHIFFKRR